MPGYRSELWMARCGAIVAGCVAALGCGRAWAPPPEWAPATKAAPFTVIDLRVRDGTLPLQLAKAAADAAALHQEPYVELTSSWCRACHWLDHGLSDPELSRAFSGTYVIRVDVDSWTGRLEGTRLDYHTGPIPAFVALSDNGQPVGEWADARMWQSEIPRQAAPALASFFHGGEFVSSR
jgi:thiol:disulfide interchange protein